MKIESVCVFAASSPAIPDIYLDAARELASALVSNEISMTYGAGAVGIMGVMADTMLEEKGRVTGVIPSFMVKMGWAHDRVSRLVKVKSMHDRKRRMIRGVDAVVAMPGGVGTLEEVMEVITLKQLGQFLKPIVILNTNGFYDPLLKQMEKMVIERFMRPLHNDIWQVCNEPSRVLDTIERAPDWDGSRIKYAAVDQRNDDIIRTSGQ